MNKSDIREAIGRIRQVALNSEPDLDALNIAIELERLQEENHKLKKLVKTIVNYMAKFHDSNEEAELNEIEDELMGLTAND